MDGQDQASQPEGEKAASTSTSILGRWSQLHGFCTSTFESRNIFTESSIFGLIGNFHEFHEVILDRSHSPQVNEHHLSSTEVCEHHRLIDSDALADSPEHSVMAQESVWPCYRWSTSAKRSCGQRSWGNMAIPFNIWSQSAKVVGFPSFQFSKTSKTWHTLVTKSFMHQSNQSVMNRRWTCCTDAGNPSSYRPQCLEYPSRGSIPWDAAGTSQVNKIRWGNWSYRYVDVGDIWDVITKSKDTLILRNVSLILSCFFLTNLWLFVPSRNNSGQDLGGFSFDSLLGGSFASGTYGAARLWKAPCQHWNEDSCQLGYLDKRVRWCFSFFLF